MSNQPLFNFNFSSNQAGAQDTKTAAKPTLFSFASNTSSDAAKTNEQPKLFSFGSAPTSGNAPATQYKFEFAATAKPVESKIKLKEIKNDACKELFKQADLEYYILQVDNQEKQTWTKQDCKCVLHVLDFEDTKVLEVRRPLAIKEDDVTKQEIIFNVAFKFLVNDTTMFKKITKTREDSEGKKVSSYRLMVSGFNMSIAQVEDQKSKPASCLFQMKESNEIFKVLSDQCGIKLVEE